MRNRTKLLSQAALMCALLVISILWMKFTLPGTDLLITTQIFFVLLCGFVLPPKYCLAALGSYLALGLVGFPIFSAVSGPAVLATPAFGYLISFPLAAALTSLVDTRIHRRWGCYLAAVLGLLTSYLIALPYIAFLKNIYLKTPISLSTLLSSYCLIFLPLDIIKAILAAALGKRMKKTLRSERY